jgi:hypothetical protein
MDGLVGVTEANPNKKDPLTGNLEKGKVYLYGTANMNVFHIGYYDGESPTHIVVRKWALLAVIQQPGAPAANINLSKPPGEFLGKQVSETLLSKQDIMYVVEPKKDMVNAYMGMMSGLVTPQAGQPMPPPPGAR